MFVSVLRRPLRRGSDLAADRWREEYRMDEPLSNPDTKLREDARNCIREVLRQSPDSRSYRVQGGPPLATAPYPVNPPYPPLRSNQPAASAASRCPTDGEQP